MSPRARRACAQRGFSLVAAIFLLVVLAALGAFAARINVLSSRR
jgi:Tfp pilus assembly protein PilX